MARTPPDRTARRAHYFARGEGSAFNISNIIEDTIEAVVGFTLRFVYTNALLFWSPRVIVFHILTHDRQLRITRPYSYFFASFLLFTAAFTLSLAFEARWAELLEYRFGKILSFREFLKHPGVETTLVSLAPALFGVLIITWIAAILVSAVLVPPRWMRRLLTPIYFGIVYIAGLYFLALGSLALSEALFWATLEAQPPKGYIDVPYQEVLAFAVYGAFWLVISVTLARLLAAFSTIGARRGWRRLTRILRTTVAWFVVSAALFAAVASTALIPTAAHDVSARLDLRTKKGPVVKLSCAPAANAESVFAGGGAATQFQSTRQATPFLRQAFDVLVINEGTDLDLKEMVALSGHTARCSDLSSAASCKSSGESQLGMARIVEPSPTAGMVIIPEKGMLGVRVEVIELTSAWAQSAQFVSAPSFEFSSARFPGLRQMWGAKCEPFRREQQWFADRFGR
jgi:hypothetical protein